MKRGPNDQGNQTTKKQHGKTTKTQNQNEEIDGSSPDMIQPDVSTKIVAYHALTTVEELCIDKSLFTRGQLLNRLECAMGESCAKSGIIHTYIHM